MLAELIAPIEEIYQTEAMARGIYLESFGLEETSKLIGKEITEV